MDAARERGAVARRSPLPMLIALGLLFAPVARTLHGQEIEPLGPTSDLAYTVGNAAIGGLAAALIHSAHGGSFWQAFVGGAAGGAVAYGGRRLSAADFAGAGLLGRGMGSVGGSWARNAAEGRGLLDGIAVPLVVARLYAGQEGGRWRARLRLDVPTAVVTAYLLLRPDADFDARASLSAGAPVFYRRERDADSWQGVQVAGVIWLTGDPWDPWPDVPEPVARSHELVHVLQYDFTQVIWGRNLDRFVSQRLPLGEWQKHLDLGVHIAGWGLANSLLPHRLRPWEWEARYLGSTTLQPK